MTPKKMNITLWSILVTMILAIAGGLYFADMFLSGLAGDTAHLKAESQINRNRADIYSENKLRLQEYTDLQELADEIVPATQDQSAIVAEISEFARQSGVGVGGIVFEQPVVTKGKKSAAQIAQEKSIPKGTALVPLTVELAQGSGYGSVIHFLEILENNRRKIQITDVSMTPSADNGSILEQVTLKLNLYVKAETKTPAAKEEDK